jgi:hypothetical protein
MSTHRASLSPHVPSLRGKGQRFWTVVSDLVRGEVIGFAQDRAEETLPTPLTMRRDRRSWSAVEVALAAVAPDGAAG